MANIARVYKDNGMMPEWEDRQFDRKRKLAEALQAQSMEMPQGQMVSGHYVAANPLQYMAKMLQGYNAKKEMEGYDKQQQDVLQQREEASSSAGQKFVELLRGGQVDPMQSEMPTENPDGSTSYGATPTTAPDKNAALSYALSDPNAQRNPIVGAMLPELLKGQTPNVKDINGQIVDLNDPQNLNRVIPKQTEKRPIVVDGVVLDPDTYQPLYTAPQKPTPYKTEDVHIGGGKWATFPVVNGQLDMQHPIGQPFDKRPTASTVNATASNAPMMPGKEGMNKVDTGLIDSGARRQRLSQISQSFKPEFLTFGNQIGQKWNSLRERGGANLGVKDKKSLEDFTQFKAGVLDNVNNYVKEITGAAMSEAEAGRIMATMPNLDMSPTEFKAALDKSIKTLNLAEARLAYIKRNGLQVQEPWNISLDTIPLKMKERAISLQSELGKTLKGDALKQAVKQKIAEEFGLVGD